MYLQMRNFENIKNIIVFKKKLPRNNEPIGTNAATLSSHSRDESNFRNFNPTVPRAFEMQLKFLLLRYNSKALASVEVEHIIP